jgi:hypothetical protein
MPVMACHPWACSDQGHTQFTGQFSFGVRHVNSSAFIAHINQANAMRVQSHPYGHDVPAAQAVDPFDALADQIAGNQVSHGGFG